MKDIARFECQKLEVGFLTTVRPTDIHKAHIDGASVLAELQHFLDSDNTSAVSPAVQETTFAAEKASDALMPAELKKDMPDDLYVRKDICAKLGIEVPPRTRSNTLVKMIKEHFRKELNALREGFTGDPELIAAIGKAKAKELGIENGSFDDMEITDMPAALLDMTAQVKALPQDETPEETETSEETEIDIDALQKGFREHAAKLSVRCAEAKVDPKSALMAMLKKFDVKTPMDIPAEDITDATAFLTTEVETMIAAVVTVAKPEEPADEEPADDWM